MNICAVIGSLRAESRTAQLVYAVAAAAERHGGTVQYLDLRTQPLPNYSDDTDYPDDPHLKAAGELVTWADGFIVGSPEYHGSMSGVTKNFFDHYYHRFSGKTFALVAAAGGGSAISCFTHMRATVQYCHGWTLPFQVGLEESKIPADGLPTDARALDRLERLGRDLVVYGRLLKAQFDADLPLEGTASGFAGFHRKALLGK